MREFFPQSIKYNFTKKSALLQQKLCPESGNKRTITVVALCVFISVNLKYSVKTN